MLIAELKEILNQYDENLEVFVAFGDDDGEDFVIEANECAICLVAR